MHAPERPVMVILARRCYTLVRPEQRCHGDRNPSKVFDLFVLVVVGRQVSKRPVLIQNAKHGICRASINCRRHGAIDQPLGHHHIDLLLIWTEIKADAVTLGECIAKNDDQETVRLFGISNLQIVIYYKNYPDDSWIYRYSVCQCLPIVENSFGYLLSCHGSMLGSQMVMIIWVEALYTVRLWKLGGHFNRTLSWIVVLTVVIALGSGILYFKSRYTMRKAPICVCVVTVLHIQFPVDTNNQGMPRVIIEGSICVLFAVAATSDFIIAFSMCYYLHKSREASAFSSTSDMLYGLMRLVVISGLATRLNSRKDHRATNSASPGQNVLRFNYKDSGNELHTSIPPMQSIASLEHAKGGPNPNV
ncbi:hypothetical protein EDD18DRAFT_1111027 [Armillaria luteobubalina]|uniref:DUF6534 domain-containing protein n=1 Tax=Armillaria luteobubalina TaxID=153913 RepID=A0AA39PM12_9AGAR|nr:hypothetical protein EDD18DRAFT_1111027 [Armillaria luteobubalina]